MSTERLSDAMFARLADVADGASPASVNRRMALQRDWERALGRESVLANPRQAHGVLGASPRPGQVRATPPAESRFPAVSSAPDSIMARGSMPEAQVARPRPSLVGPHITATGNVPSPQGVPSVPIAAAAASPRPIAGAPTFNVTRAAPCPLPYASAARVAWAPYAVHVMNRSGFVKIWIRDNHFRSGSGRQLLAALRHELTKTGARLATLVVNGTTIWQR